MFCLFAKQAQCTHFNYDYGICWLKSGSVSKKDAKHAAADSVCGIVVSAEDNNNNNNNNKPSEPSSTANGVRFNLINKCSFDIWPGMLGKSVSDPNWRLPHNGGWLLKAGQESTVTVPRDFTAGRVWARTGCRTDEAGNFRCDTGDCGPWVQCSHDNVMRGGMC